MWLKCSLYSENCFYLTSGYFLRAPDNSNFFLFLLKVPVRVDCIRSTKSFGVEDYSHELAFVWFFIGQVA